MSILNFNLKDLSALGFWLSPALLLNLPVLEYLQKVLVLEYLQKVLVLVVSWAMLSEQHNRSDTKRDTWLRETCMPLSVILIAKWTIVVWFFGKSVAQISLNEGAGDSKQSLSPLEKP